jgi:enterochelin esterase-like enzyme
MKFDILSQNLILYVCIIFTALSFYVISSLYKPDPKKKKLTKKARIIYDKENRIQFGGAVGVSLLLAIILHILISNSTSSFIPNSFILMALPGTTTLCLLGLSIIFKKRLIVLAGVLFIIGLLFSLIIINDYYRYYPTLGEVFGQTNTQAFSANLNNVTVRYTEATNQSSYNSRSIQDTLENISNAPTSGKLYKLDIPGKVSKLKARSAYVYLPAIYNSPGLINLPVIVLTSGVPGSPSDWVGLGIKNVMDQFAKSHDGITPIVFMVDDTGSVNNDTECVNSPRGNIETYLSVDVPNFIKKNFHVEDSPTNWAIGGISLGGTCSIMMTLLHPNVYHYFIDLGGEIGPEVGSKQQTIDQLFHRSEKDWAAHQPSILLATHTYKNIGGFFGDGNQDTRDVTSAITQLSIQSKKAGIDSVSETLNGAHTFNVWAQTYEDSLPWISNRIGATQCGSSCI